MGTTLKQIFLFLCLAVGTFFIVSRTISRRTPPAPEDLRETGIRLQAEAVANVQGELHKCAIMQSEIADSTGDRRQKLMAVMPQCEALQSAQVEKQLDPELRRSMLTEVSRQHDAVVRERAKDLIGR